MAIGIVSDDELNEELNKIGPTPQEKKPVITPKQELVIPGRSEGDVNVPDSLRKLIGEESVINGRQAALGLAGMFGVSASSVSAYAKGATSTTSYNEPKKELVGHLNNSRKRYTKRAGRVLAEALSKIDENKLNDMNAKELSGIAKDMSGIIKNLEPPTAADGSSVERPQFVIFAPQFRDERSFPVITVQE